ncbi:pilus assembly protein [Sphingobium indicum]|uniref:TadE family protein n=2 Tax=Sphingobium indicum TaxID=332055 RepID=A0A1L5BNV0_SPHIB|nr:TadE family protein [Sphingobium indicum]APL94536.1 TadE family protein [Sphingobium indicum B90A]KEY97696.1 TadE family protein [Sphingomonas sp. BHC-A]NYI23332.1 Flp pilus assembly protein TadG [Sphingobium indicum]RYM04286.1 pilus assembly protein [Sphingobium indicum]
MIRLARDQRGAAAIEFVLAVPPFIMLLMGALQLGIIACARTGLQHAVDEGARYASIFPRPSDTDIIAKVNSREFGLDPAYTNNPTVTHGTQYGVPYTEITMTYSRPLNFIVYQTRAISISYTRRAY